MKKTSLRKSINKKAIKGNKTKYDAYQEVFARIKAANKSGFFLESVVIQETIISDKLKSHSAHIAVLPKKKHPTLNDFIKAWKRESQVRNNSLAIKLAAEVDLWRGLRNKAVHGLVATQSVNDFLANA